MKFLTYDTEDVSKVIESGKKKTRLEVFATAEIFGRMQLIIADALLAITGMNNLAKFVSDAGDQIERFASIAGAAANGLGNSSNVLKSNNIFAQLGSQHDKIKGTVANAIGDNTKGGNFMDSATKAGNGVVADIRGF